MISYCYYDITKPIPRLTKMRLLQYRISTERLASVYAGLAFLSGKRFTNKTQRAFRIPA